MNQKRFHGIANSGALTLRVERDALSHVEIGLVIHIHVAHAVIVFDDGHAGVFDNGFDERMTATRDNEIDILIHAGHQGYRVPILR